MKKRIIALALAGALVLPTVSSVFAAAENTQAVQTQMMEFKGEAVELTLQQAIDIALKNNPSIEQAKLELEQDNVAYDKGNSGIRTARKRLKEFNKDSSTYLTAVTKSSVANELGWAIAQREYQKALDTQKREVEKMYFGVLHAQQGVDIQEENLKVAKDLYEKTKKKLELGQVAKQEVTSSELNYIKAQKSLTGAKNGLTAAKMGMNIFLGYDVMNNIELKDELIYKKFTPVDIEKVTDEALKNRVDMLQAELGREIAKIDMEVAEKKYAKVVFEYREKEVLAKKAEKGAETAKKSVEMDVRNKYLAVMQKQEEIKAAEKSVELSQTMLDSALLSYDLGMAVLTDAQQAQIGLQAEKLAQSQAILDYNIAVLEFEESLGQEIK
jgi:outer membrane protein TolC